MSLIEETLYGQRDKVAIAIERLQAYEPEEGYYLAFSGGKDSQCIYHLAVQAGVKFEAHYHVTTVDPPELIYFIREQYPDVIFDRPKRTMWQLIVDNLCPPMRMQRYCCGSLKEGGGEGRRVVTGVRWAESAKRAKNHNVVGIKKTKSYKSYVQMDDNDESRRLVENCLRYNKITINPIVDWSCEDVWEYLSLLGVPHCKLYDEGFERLGCIGCPISTANMRKELERWPRFRAQYIRTFERMLDARAAKGKEMRWANAEAVMEWWMGEEQEEHGGLFDEQEGKE